MLTDPKGRDVYEGLRSEESAILLLPTHMTTAELKSYENSGSSELTAALKEPGLATLGLILASTLGIPWIFPTSNDKNTTSTTTTTTTKPPKQRNPQTVYYLELSDHEVRVLESIYSLPNNLSRDTDSQ